MDGKTQEVAAAASGMSLRTAREWETGPVPSATKQPRDWRTRPDPFGAVWKTDVEPLLQRDLKGTGVRTTLATFGEVAGTHMMEQARQSKKIAAVSHRLARLLPVLTPADVARQLTDAVERDARTVTIPRRLAGAVHLRNLPSTLQDLVFLGLKT